MQSKIFTRGIGRTFKQVLSCEVAVVTGGWSDDHCHEIPSHWFCHDVLTSFLSLLSWAHRCCNPCRAGLHPGQASSLLKADTERQSFAFTLYTTCSQFWDFSTSVPLLSSVVVSTGVNTVPTITSLILLPRSWNMESCRHFCRLKTKFKESWMEQRNKSLPIQQCSKTVLGDIKKEKETGWLHRHQQPQQLEWNVTWPQLGWWENSRPSHIYIWEDLWGLWVYCSFKKLLF